MFKDMYIITPFVELRRAWMSTGSVSTKTPRRVFPRTSTCMPWRVEKTARAIQPELSQLRFLGSPISPVPQEGRRHLSSQRTGGTFPT